MLYLRKAEDRGHFKIDWLDSYHTFSFGDYYDPQFMGFRDLRVINHDTIAGESGFPLHPHRDMEIITYVLKGTVEHKDSLGNIGQVKAGEIQVMHAGSGIRHSEYNPSKDPLLLFQVWIQPNQAGVPAGYTQQSFTREEKLNRLRLMASSDGREDSQKIYSDAEMHVGIFEAGQSFEFSCKEGKSYWVQLAYGEAVINGQKISGADAVALQKENRIQMTFSAETEFLLFELK